jgi:hypothetical protein
MIKKLFFGFVFLVIIALVALYMFGSGVINKTIKTGVETYGPQVTQTDVTLEDVNISILSGSGSLKNLNIGNPEGYKSENIFALGEIDVNVEIGSLLSDKIIIEHIIIRKPEISYEKTLMSSNVKKLMKNIEEFTGPKTEPATPEEPEPQEPSSKQVVVKKLLIEGGSIYVGAMGVGQVVPLPTIEMTDIGESGDTMTPVEVFDLILSKILTSIGPAIANAGDILKEQGQAALDSATEEASESLGEAAGDAANKVSEGIKGLFGK